MSSELALALGVAVWPFLALLIGVVIGRRSVRPQEPPRREPEPELAPTFEWPTWQA